MSVDEEIEAALRRQLPGWNKAKNVGVGPLRELLRLFSHVPEAERANYTLERAGVIYPHPQIEEMCRRAGLMNGRVVPP